MKKLYSFLLLAIIGLVSFEASAISVTFKINTPGSAVILNAENSNVIPFDGTESTLDITGNLIIVPTGNYELVSVVKNDDETLNASNILFSQLAEGDVVTITTKEKAGRTLKIVGDANHMYVSDYSYRYLYASDQTDGAWVLKNIPDYQYINVYANSGYTLTSVKDDNDNELLSGSQSSYQLYTSSWDGDKTIYVTSANLNDLRDKSVTIKVVDGNPSDVKVSRNGSGEETLTEAETIYKYFDEELPICLSHASFNKTLYKVTVADVDASLNGNYYKIRPNDGDIIEVTPDYPDVDVPVKFNFSSDDITGIISSMRVDGQIVTDWNRDDFTVKLGSKVSLSFNYTDYDISAITVNGTALQYFYSYDFSVTDVNGYTIDFTATKKPDLKATIYCENYEHLLVYNGYGYSSEPTIELTDIETVVTLSPSKPYLTFKAKGSEYIVSSLDCSGSCVNSYQTQVQVTGTDAYIEISMEKIERTKQAVVYLQPDASWHPNYTYIKLSPYRDSEYTVYLKAGYQILKFGSFDNTTYVSFSLSDYSSSIVGYQNDQSFDGYIYNMDLADGDVIKVFDAEPATYSVTYDIEEGAPVKVFHDYITAIENPASHTVFQGTEIHIKPEAAQTQNDGVLVVKVNDTAVTPDENGVYVAIVNADTKIEAYLDSNSGVEDVEVETGAPVDVYNLQGIEVIHQATPAQIQQLPAGIYVAGGKKTVVR